ncbi:11396_t:CDS:10 [Acaulospora morrowiae]|uniref:11396_t:CDS:1 n=1 Tax=Acaulospora morrowiae TaxID=94023 RepID=A0A9N8ZCG0_9GLOM|nr:11396_t:CDS:10 [Acaulospora morrowiae]
MLRGYKKSPSKLPAVARRSHNGNLYKKERSPAVARHEHALLKERSPAVARHEHALLVLLSQLSAVARAQSNRVAKGGLAFTLPWVNYRLLPGVVVMDIGISLWQKRKHKEITEDFVSENAKYISLQNTINQNQRAQTPLHQSRAQMPPHQLQAQTPPHQSRVQTPPPRYIESIQIVCVFGTNKSKSKELVGKELANKISSYRKRIPSTWTSGLEKYLKDAFNKTEKQFKLVIQEEIIGEDGNKFRLYCEKVLMEFYNLVDVFLTLSRNIKERKFTIYHISPFLKLYKFTFGTLEFNWIESHVQSAKIMKSPIDSGIVLVDVNGVWVRDYKEIFHMEVSGSPSNPTIRHTTGDTKKTLHTDILNLVDVLRDHLDLDMKLAKEVKVYSMQVIAYRLTLYALSIMEDSRFVAYELSSVELPFDFDSRSKYMAVLRIMAIFHDEMVQQAVIMNKIDSILIPSEGTCVRDVLKIPENL